MYRERESAAGEHRPPRLVQAPREQWLAPGKPFEFELPIGTFAASYVGDVLSFTAQQEGGEDLPQWLRFDAESMGFSGQAPATPGLSLVLTVRATDFDNAWVEGRLVLNIGDGKDGELQMAK
jgi:hypothetical protein